MFFGSVWDFLAHICSPALIDSRLTLSTPLACRLNFGWLLLWSCCGNMSKMCKHSPSQAKVLALVFFVPTCILIVQMHTKRGPCSSKTSRHSHRYCLPWEENTIGQHTMLHFQMRVATFSLKQINAHRKMQNLCRSINIVAECIKTRENTCESVVYLHMKWRSSV